MLQPMFTIPAHLALTGSELLAMVTLLLGSSGLSAIVASIASIRRVRLEAATSKADAEVRIRTVAAEEAEAAIRIMGASLVRLKEEVVVLNKRIEECEQKHREHSLVCPL